MKHYSWIALVLLPFLLVLGCSDDQSSEPTGGNNSGIEDLDIPGDFNYETVRSVNLDVEVVNALSLPAAGRRVFVFYQPADESVTEIAKGITDSEGKFYANVVLPRYIEVIGVITDVIGINNFAEVDVTSGEAIVALGPVDLALSSSGEGFAKYGLIQRRSSELDEYSFETLGNWDESGHPNYLETQREDFNNEFLDALNDAFPLWEPIEETHPDYLRQFNASRVTDVRITGETDVYVSYISSGGRSVHPPAAWPYKASAGGYFNTEMFIPNYYDAVGFYYHTQSNAPGEHFTVVEPTGDYYAIAIQYVELNGVRLEEGDEIAAFDGDICVGSTNIDNYPLDLSCIQGSSSPPMPGFSIGNDIIFKIWDYSHGREVTVEEDEVEYMIGNGTFGFGFASQVTIDAISDETSLEIIFPNTMSSWFGSVLDMGDRVNIGEFHDGDVIGWWIGASAWDPDVSQVTEEAADHFYFSDDALNNDLQNGDDNQRIVTLADYENERLVIGFERDMYSYEHWYTDMGNVFLSVTFSDWSAVDLTGIATLDGSQPDTDEDGICDLVDEYPNDADKAFNNYYPGGGSWGRLAFEDLWPRKGDYDFNDLVVAYQGNHITNAQNEVVEIVLSFDVKAVGASYRNGFAVEMPFAFDDVASVTGNEGYVTDGNLFSLNGNGTEAGQTNAVIPVFDETSLVTNTPAGEFVNTEPGATSVDPETITLTITLDSDSYFDPTDYNGDIPVATPYNPFIIVNHDRSVEVHLAGYAPTDLMNEERFGQDDDDSIPGEGRYYKSANNLPWGLLLPGEWDHVVEMVELLDAYVHFQEWAETGGELYQDWYVDQPGYIVQENIWTAEE